jgi:hypothetical protein
MVQFHSLAPLDPHTQMGSSNLHARTSSTTHTKLTRVLMVRVHTLKNNCPLVATQVTPLDSTECRCPLQAYRM